MLEQPARNDCRRLGRSRGEDEHDASRSVLWGKFCLHPYLFCSPPPLIGALAYPNRLSLKSTACINTTKTSPVTLLIVSENS